LGFEIRLLLGFKNALFIGTKKWGHFQAPSRQNIRYTLGGALAPMWYPIVPLVSLA
jgi:hypothetical protein